MAISDILYFRNDGCFENKYILIEINLSSFSVVLIMLIDLIFKISLIPTNHDYLKDFLNLNIIR